jgi:RNA polymerase sigma factor (sigma-70 family)
MANHSWDEIYVKNAPKLLGVCRRYIKDIALAEDLMHEAFITAMQKHNDYNGSGSIEAWLHRIMVNTTLNHLRGAKNKEMVSDENIDLIDNSTDEMNNFNSDYKSKILSADFSQTQLLEAIDAVPDHHKSVFNMYVIDKFSHKEIAKTLDITIGTSKSHLSRARKKIQDFLYKKNNNTEEKKRRFLFILFAMEIILIKYTAKILAILLLNHKQS